MNSPFSVSFKHHFTTTLQFIVIVNSTKKVKMRKHQFLNLCRLFSLSLFKDFPYLPKWLWCYSLISAFYPSQPDSSNFIFRMQIFLLQKINKLIEVYISQDREILCLQTWNGIEPSFLMSHSLITYDLNLKKLPEPELT